MSTISLIRWLVASIHLMGLGLGLGAIWSRSRALNGLPDPRNLQRALYADALWGIAALVWITTGLARAFGGLEKGSAYYLSNDVFLLKMALLGVVLLLEHRHLLAQPRRARLLVGIGGCSDFLDHTLVCLFEINDLYSAPYLAALFAHETSAFIPCLCIDVQTAGSA